MNILITGAGGFLASALIQQLQYTDNYIFALTGNKEKITSRFGEWLTVYDMEDWGNGDLPMKNIDVVIHCAFARAHKGGKEIAKSLLFTENLFSNLIENSVPALINISTQEVYGKMLPPWEEEKGEEPNTIYGTAKYYTELMAENLSEKANCSVTNIRLAGLLSVDTDSRIVNRFVDSAMKNEPLMILDGKLIFSQLDVRDAAAGIIALLSVPSMKWKTSYNLGFTQSYSIKEIADSVKEIAKEYEKDVQIHLEESDIIIEAELDSSALYTQTGWKPKYDMKDIVKSVFEYKIRNSNGI